ncbi:MAG: cytochrome c oxidase assembly protein [Thermoleophilia bacterium]|nr:cytochrome c oxidase assembly protein [Thermoleophilia bacterium]
MALPIAHASLGVSIIGLILVVVLGTAYGVAASRPSPRGNRWPLRRTIAFLSGLTLFSLVVQSPLAVYDETRWAHAAQHLLVMMVIPPLLVLGAPLTLLLRSVSPHARREIVGVLHDPAMKRFSGPVAGIGLTLEYHGTMFLVMLTGLYGYTLQHEWAHVLTHAYLFTCGLLFWMPLIGRDPAGFRPPPWAKVAMVASGIPASVLLGLLMSGRDETAAWVLGAGGVALTLAGLALLAAQGAGRRFGSGEPWSQRRTLAMNRAMSTQQVIDPEP